MEIAAARSAITATSRGFTGSPVNGTASPLHGRGTLLALHLQASPAGSSAAWTGTPRRSHAMGEGAGRETNPSHRPQSPEGTVDSLRTTAV